MKILQAMYVYLHTYVGRYDMYVLGMHSVNIVTFSPLGCMQFFCPHFHPVVGEGQETGPGTNCHHHSHCG